MRTERSVPVVPQDAELVSARCAVPDGHLATCSLANWVGEESERRESFLSENQVKLHRVYVRMPRHQEPTKDVV